MSDFDLHRRLSGLERRVSKLEDGYHELDNVVDPQGWIGEAFKLLDDDVEEIKTELATVNRKLDVILQHLTGMNEN